ncbi:MAG: S9 family peptidase, partial [Gammaproteobacteria bacterium]
MNDSEHPKAPVAARRPVEHTLHGRTRTDPYAWLKDESWQQVMRDPARLNQDIKAYLDAENAYTQSVMADTETLQSTLFGEMRGRIKEDDSSVPEDDGPFSYYVRYAKGGQHPIYCRRPKRGRTGDEAAEQVLLHGDEQAKGHDFFSVGTCDHSHDHCLLAYSVDLNGSEIYTIYVKELASGELLADRIDNAQGDISWATDNEHLFYTVLDDNHRPSYVFRHRLGTPARDDELVYEELDPGFFVGVSLTESRRFIVIDAHDHETSEVRLVDGGRPLSQPVVVAPREAGIEYSVSHSQRAGTDELLILTNANGAEDFEIVHAATGTPGREHWQALVAHQPGKLIVSMEVFKDYLIRLERENALPRIVVRSLASGHEHSIAFEEEAYSLGLDGGLEFDTTVLRFSYSSPTTPARVYDYDMATRDRVLRKEQEVPSG